MARVRPWITLWRGLASSEWQWIPRAKAARKPIRLFCRDHGTMIVISIVTGCVVLQHALETRCASWQTARGIQLVYPKRISGISPLRQPTQYARKTGLCQCEAASIANWQVRELVWQSCIPVIRRSPIDISFLPLPRLWSVHWISAQWRGSFALKRNESHAKRFVVQAIIFEKKKSINDVK